MSTDTSAPAEELQTRRKLTIRDTLALRGGWDAILPDVSPRIFGRGDEEPSTSRLMQRQKSYDPSKAADLFSSLGAGNEHPVSSSSSSSEDEEVTGLWLTESGLVSGCLHFVVVGCGSRITNAFGSSPTLSLA